MKSMTTTSLLPALALALALSLGAPGPAPAQQGGNMAKLKSEVRKWLKQRLPRPDTYQEGEWGKVVTHDQGGRSFSLRHVYRYQDRAGVEHTEDRIFAFDLMGRVSGIESLPPGVTPRWHNHRP
jgi:hypothetical protein